MVSTDNPIWIFPILFAISWKVASAAVCTPWSVTAAAIVALPLLTEDFKLFISDDRLVTSEILWLCDVLALPLSRLLVSVSV